MRGDAHDDARSSADLRRALDDIDKVILNALGERARLTEDIARGQGRATTSPLRDGEREAALLAHRAAYGERLGLDPAFVRRIYREILDDSVRRQQDWLQLARGRRPPLSVGLSGDRGRLRPPGGVGSTSASSRRPVTLQGLPVVP